MFYVDKLKFFTVMKLVKALVDILIWLRVFISPFLVFIGLGFFVWFALKKTMTADIICAVIVVIGLVTSVLITKRVKRRFGLSHFVSRVNASPELDNLD